MARWRALFGCVALVLAGQAGIAAAETKALKFVPQADLKTFDPMWTTALITINHGYMVYDTLFALDGSLVAKPQMVESYQRSPDGLLTSFKLRDGLKFTDGTPVEAKDVVASLKRWAVRSSPGQILMRSVGEVTATGPSSFDIKLKQPFGPLIETLGNPDSPLFIMREKEALTDPFQQIQEIVGSGPFIFVKDEWAPGSKVVYKKNPDYKPRAEPASGLAGGKVAHLDRVEWIYIPDANTATQALVAGEVDAIDLPAADLLPVLRKSDKVTVAVLDKLGYLGVLRPNQLIPPFNNAKMRQALLYLAGDQADYLNTVTSSPDYRRPCNAVFLCGTPLETNAGVGAWSTNDEKTNLATAKKLIAEAGYKGERVVVMDPTDFPSIHALTLITAEKLRLAGINVELQSLDWSTAAARRAVKDAPDQNPGGWNIFHSVLVSGAAFDPLSAVAAGANCDKAWFGWPCDDELEKDRLAFVTASSAEERKALAAKYQERFYAETVPFVPLGQSLQPTAYRTNVKGVVNATRFVFWNVDKD